MIRDATAGDAAALAAVYAPAVLRGTGTFEFEPPDAAEMAARLGKVQAQGWPWLVHATHEHVDGYAYASQFRDRPAYARTAETSVYVAPAAQGSGVGRALMLALCDAAAAAGFEQLVAVIGDGAGNLASVALHRACGFRDAGRLTEVGIKFGRRLDVVYMQRDLRG